MAKSKMANIGLYYDYKILGFQDDIYIGFYELDDKLSRFYDRCSMGASYIRERVQFGRFYKEHPHYKLYYNMRWYRFPAYNSTKCGYITNKTIKLAMSYINVILSHELQPNAEYPRTYCKQKYTRASITEEMPTFKAVKMLKYRIYTARANLLNELRFPNKHCI